MEKNNVAWLPINLPWQFALAKEASQLRSEQFDCMPGGLLTKALQRCSSWFEVVTDFPQYRQADILDFEKCHGVDMWRVTQEHIDLTALQ
jgi:hypothetical protein